MLPLWLAVCGLLFGSFLNVCIYRVPRDLSVVTPRSFCPDCATTIVWYHNVPVVSFLFLQGKCHSCGRPIPWRYPLVEITAAALFGMVGWRYGWSVDTVKWLLFESILLVLFWTDIEERLLPDELTVGGTVAGLALAFVVPVHAGLIDFLLRHWAAQWRSLVNALSGAFILAVPLWLFGWLYSAVRKRDGLGFGDVKLLALMGIFLGMDAGILALLAGAIGGSILGVAYVLATRQDMRTYELPFGSFLCAGAALVPLVTRLVGS